MAPSQWPMVSELFVHIPIISCFVKHVCNLPDKSVVVVGHEVHRPQGIGTSSDVRFPVLRSGNLSRDRGGGLTADTVS
jgi:hypothetical protein